jgi:hypothetical protein
MVASKAFITHKKHPMLQSPEKKECLQCGHALRGRVDKKFCNDYCRNAYNNGLKSAQYATVRRINAILLRNRRALASLLGTAGSCKMPREELLLQGVQLRYHTHQYVNGRGAVYCFCYEFGWLELPGDRYLLVRRSSAQERERLGAAASVHIEHE